LYLSDKRKFPFRKITKAEWDKWENRKSQFGKTPGRFMYKSLARIWLEITGVRVERVQEITQSDCISEGICPHLPCYFQKLWDSLNAKRGFGWDKNPWVRVIEFKKIEVPNVNG